MFGFLNPKKNEPKRDIFEYFDGERTRSVDPILAYETLVRECDGEEPVTLLRTIAMEPPPTPPGVDVSKMVEKFKFKRDLCTQSLCKAACVAFSVKEYAEDENGKRVGLTRAERIRLVKEFLYYLADLAEKARPFGNS